MTASACFTDYPCSIGKVCQNNDNEMFLGTWAITNDQYDVAINVYSGRTSNYDIVIVYHNFALAAVAQWHGNMSLLGTNYFVTLQQVDTKTHALVDGKYRIVKVELNADYMIIYFPCEIELVEDIRSRALEGMINSNAVDFPGSNSNCIISYPPNSYRISASKEKLETYFISKEKSKTFYLPGIKAWRLKRALQGSAR